MDRLPQPTDTEDHRQLPVSLLDLKEQLRIEHDEQDRLLLTKIMSATSEAEQFIGSPIMAQSFALVFDGFPASGGAIELPTSPIRSITSITYYDGNGDSQTLDAAEYGLATWRAIPDIYPVSGAWPDTQERENAVTVTYVAGYASKPSAVPAAIREAVLLRAATRASMSEESGVGNVAWKLDDALAFGALLNPFRNLHV